MGEPVPPSFHTFWPFFSPDWNNLVYNVFLLLNCRKGHTKAFTWVIVWIQPDPTISKHAYSLITSNPDMYLKEGWACPPFLSYILDLFFFWSKDCILPRVCFDALCNEKWFWTQQHFLTSRGLNQEKCKSIANRKTRGLKTEIQKEKPKTKQEHQTQTTKWTKLRRHQVLIDLFCLFCVFFLVNLHIECFLVIWCVLIAFFFSFCWCQIFLLKPMSYKVKWTESCACIQPNPAISNHIYPRSNHIYPRHAF